MQVALRSRFLSERFASPHLQALIRRRFSELGGIALALVAIAMLVALATYNPHDSSLDTSTGDPARNLAGPVGATFADLALQYLGIAGGLPVLVMLAWAWRIASGGGLGSKTLRLIALLCALPVLASVLAGIPLLLHPGVGATLPTLTAWSPRLMPGGSVGLLLAQAAIAAGQAALGAVGGLLVWLLALALALLLVPLCLGLSAREWRAVWGAARSTARYPIARGRGARRRGLEGSGGARRSFRERLSGGRGGGAGLSDDEEDFDHVLPGESPFAASMRGREPGFAGAASGGMALALGADPQTGKPAGRLRKAAERREPSLRARNAAVDTSRSAQPSALAGRGGWVMPPGAEEEPEEQPILPLRSRAALKATRAPGEDQLPTIRLGGPQQPGQSVAREGAGDRQDGFASPPAAEPAPGRDARGGILSFGRLLGGGRHESAPRPAAAAAAAAAAEPDWRRTQQGAGQGAGQEAGPGHWSFPPLSLLQPAPARASTGPSNDSLQANARLLETVLSDYGVQGAIGDIHAGPVVTLYELEPAPGIRSARVIGLADDIARSLSVTAVRIATVPGRNVIGIEVPNAKRETVYFSELLGADAWADHPARLCLALGKDISGAPIYADLARMPHLLIAGTTGSGKSVGINSMILSLLYRLSPEECRLIMIDPKMLELSIYDGIPHLMAPVVTDPAKAVTALKWTVREMERRYRGMSQLGVRNINGYNDRVAQARASGEIMTRKVQTGFDPETGRPIFEEQNLSLEALPYIVVVIDEMADLMMVAGKEIETTVQRLAQMARAAGIHVIMATQRPSVDVITGTIKANFPSRISFQVISKFDSRTILGEQGAEQLLGQGDMLTMAGGGRITRVHGPFVGDLEVEEVVRHLRAQGEPVYVDEVTSIFEEESGPGSSGGGGGSGNGLGGGGFDGETGLFDQAVALVAREGKASTSFIQRHLSIGYNRAAKLIEQMEKEGIVSAANHVGRREVLVRRTQDDE